MLAEPLEDPPRHSSLLELVPLRFEGSEALFVGAAPRGQFVGEGGYGEFQVPERPGLREIVRRGPVLLTRLGEPPLSRLGREPALFLDPECFPKLLRLVPLHRLTHLEKALEPERESLHTAFPAIMALAR